MPEKNRDDKKNPVSEIAELQLGSLSKRWTDYSEKMQKSIREAIDSGKKEYDELLKIWINYSNEMKKNFNKLLTGRETASADIYKTWMNYTENIGKWFSKLMSSEDITYNKLYNLWITNTEDMSKSFVHLFMEGMKKQYELYELWIDGIKLESIKKFGINEITDIFSKYFGEISEKITKTSIDALKGDTDYIQKYKEIYGYLIDSYSKMYKEILKTTGFTSLMGHTINQYLDAKNLITKYTEEYLKSIGIPTQSNINAIYEKIQILATEINNLSKKIDNLLSELKTTAKKDTHAG